LLAQGRWFSPASSTTKTGRHDIAEILLLYTKNQNQSKNQKPHNMPNCPKRVKTSIVLIVFDGVLHEVSISFLVSDSILTKIYPVNAICLHK